MLRLSSEIFNIALYSQNLDAVIVYTSPLNLSYYTVDTRL